MARHLIVGGWPGDRLIPAFNGLFGIDYTEIASGGPFDSPLANDGPDSGSYATGDQVAWVITDLAAGGTVDADDFGSWSRTGASDGTYVSEYTRWVLRADNSVVEDAFTITDTIGSSGTDLLLDAATHAHLADSLTLTTGSVLAIADALHAHAADSLTLTTASLLAVADALHAHAADSLTLTAGSVLAIADALHAHAADNVVLSTGAAPTVLVIADALHAHAADSLTLTVGSVLAIADALHSHAADGLSLSLGSTTLAITDALHAHYADSIRLGSMPTNISEIVPYILNSLVSNRVWESATPDDLPRSGGAVLPFVVWTLMGGQDAEYVGQSPAPTYSHARIQVHVAAPGAITADVLMKAVRDALLASDYTVGVYGSPVGTYDAARKLRGRFQQFSVWFQH